MDASPLSYHDITIHALGPIAVANKRNLDTTAFFASELLAKLTGQFVPGADILRTWKALGQRRAEGLAKLASAQVRKTVKTVRNDR